MSYVYCQRLQTKILFVVVTYLRSRTGGKRGRPGGGRGGGRGGGQGDKLSRPLVYHATTQWRSRLHTKIKKL